MIPPCQLLASYKVQTDEVDEDEDATPQSPKERRRHCNNIVNFGWRPFEGNFPTLLVLPQQQQPCCAPPAPYLREALELQQDVPTLWKPLIAYPNIAAVAAAPVQEGPIEQPLQGAEKPEVSRNDTPQAPLIAGLAITGFDLYPFVDTSLARTGLSNKVLVSDLDGTLLVTRDPVLSASSSGPNAYCCLQQLNGLERLPVQGLLGQRIATMIVTPSRGRVLLGTFTPENRHGRVVELVVGEG